MNTFESYYYGLIEFWEQLVWKYALKFQGDSGGGLVRNNTVIGIFACTPIYGCATGLPDIFTNVYPFVDWIRQKTGCVV